MWSRDRCPPITAHLLVDPGPLGRDLLDELCVHLAVLDVVREVLYSPTRPRLAKMKYFLKVQIFFYITYFTFSSW